MCSSPKPKTRVKGKTIGNGGGILASMSAEERKRFSERANIAQERRQNLNERTNKVNHQVSVTKTGSKNLNTRNVSTMFWLLNADLKEIFLCLFLGKPRTM